MIIKRIIFQLFERPIRLRVAILSLVCSLLIGALGVTMTYTFIGMGHIIDDTSRDNIDKTQNTIIDQISSYFGPVLRITQIGSWVGLQVEGNPLYNESLHSFLVGALFFIPQVTYVYMADIHGNFFGISSLSSKRMMQSDPEKSLPDKAKLVIEVSSAEKKYRTFIYVDAQGHPLLKENVPFKKNVIYDPRVRPWFTNAKRHMKAIWSEPYPNWDDNEIALTATTPLLNSQQEFIGVIGADIPLSKLSELLSKHKASRRGINFLMTTSGNLLGYPDVNKVYQGKGVGSIKAIGNEPVVSAYNRYERRHEKQFTFPYKAVDYLAYFTPFPKTIHDHWILGMVAPSDDFMGPVKRMNREVLYISFGILIFSIFLLVIFSRRVSYPIEVVAEHMRGLKDLHITHHPLPKSRLAEIGHMEEAITLMKEGLTSFSKYVPRDLVLKLIQSGSHKTLGGDVKRLTILFSDIENFTGMSEKWPAHVLMGHISTYFNDLSDIIMEEKGTIDKYIGDSIMAFWGAPNDDNHQIIHGCRAVLRCHKLHAQKKNYPFKTRFGLHEADVIVGNVGSSDRMNYTIFGDGVNVASRLESMNKVYGTSILVTETIQKQAKSCFFFRIVDHVAFTGRKASSLIFELIDEKTSENSSSQEWIMLNDQAFQAYEKGNFKEALNLYENVNRLYEENMTQPNSRHMQDPVSQVFIERCQDFLKTPPKTWDGIFRIQKK